MDASSYCRVLMDRAECKRPIRPSQALKQQRVPSRVGAPTVSWPSRAASERHGWIDRARVAADYVAGLALEQFLRRAAFCVVGLDVT
jgi:hypothetical protein